MLTDGTSAAVGMQLMATARTACASTIATGWVARFQDGKIVHMRAYLYSTLIQRLFGGNPG
ncbi:hypothetical protein [Variovorax sp. OV329]|uniref:hypothetical protein n=1 Tax=Variovorax sp. OV329 TaxID=1882825 RepID=UPI000B86B0CB|nr:hypothetical protein [Variovorax sp. OV329]